MPRNPNPALATSLVDSTRWITLGAVYIALVLALGWSRGTWASWGFTPEEADKYLPKYCVLISKGGDGVGTPEERATVAAFAKRAGCGGLGHYCTGLWYLHSTALPDSGLDRNHYLKQAIGEMGYALARCGDNAPLRPEILTNQGRAYIALKDYENAVKVLTQAIRRNPKYVAAYAELSGIFLLLNNREDARKTLEDGLKQSPDSRFLKLRLERLGPKEKRASEQKAPEQKAPEQKAPEQKATKPTAKQPKGPMP
jgi:tetratricopeptide (TPR) repeat protein